MNEEQRKPKVGDTVYMYRGMRSGEEGGLEAHEVTKVGRKYFYFGGGFHPHKARLSDWRLHRGSCLSRIEVYWSEEQYWEGRQRQDLWQLCREYFGKYTTPKDLTLSKLETVVATLGLDDPSSTK